MSGQTPSLGRIVLVPMDPNSNNGAEVAPAIIVRVWSDTVVNVRVLGDNKVEERRSSVQLLDGEFEEYLPGNVVRHVWRWPPRV